MSAAVPGSRLCLDFGTAFCKAAVCAPDQPPMPLRIADAAGQGTGGPDGADPSDYMLETAVLISEMGDVHFGRRALNESGSTSRVLQTIKDPLTRANEPQDLDRRLSPEFNRTSVDVSERDVIVLYLAFLTQAAVRAAAGPRSLVRAGTTPAFDAHKAAWVNTELGSMLAQAEVVSRHFADRLFRESTASRGRRSNQCFSKWW